jgi:chromosome segregation and condensation protein ScpB
MSHQKKAAVLTLLKTSANPLTAAELATLAGVAEVSDTSPTTRGYIRSLIDDGYPIGSTRQGYELMFTGKEVQEYLNSLLKRQIAISNRIQKVYDAAKREGIM